MNEEHSLDLIPEKPLISGFVAPWDTSGWYYVVHGFHAGSRLYANADVTAVRVPDALTGGDHIVTFDSHREGFDDKQGVSFRCEREDDIFIALDEQADPSFLRGFAPVNDHILTSEQRRCALYRRRYHAGDEVVLPGFCGDYPHYTVIICAADSDPVHPAPVLPRLASCEGEHLRPDVRWYLHTVFAQDEPGSLPPCLHGAGAQVRTDPDEPRRRLLHLTGGADVSAAYATTGCDMAETALRIRSGTAEVTFCGAQITLRPGCALLSGTQSVGDELGSTFSLRFLRAGSRCEVWLNTRLAGTLEAIPGGRCTFCVRVSDDGEGDLLHLSIRDRTDCPAATEDFAQPHRSLHVLGTGTRRAFPFQDSSSLSLCSGSCAIRSFPAISGKLRVETTVYPSGPSFTVVLDARDGQGNSAVRCAMYANNLFLSHGSRWHCVYDGHINGLYYPSGNWFTLSLIIDTDARLYDLYIDGALRARGFPLSAPVQSIAQIDYAASRDPLILRSLRVYDRACPSDMPLPPAPVFDVTAAPYCARGDAVTLDTAAIQRALDDAAFTGGTVLLPRGVFLSAQLFLRSDVTLYIARDATLLASQDHSLYPICEPCDSLCAHRQLGRGLIYGERVSHVRVTGGGTIDGNGQYRFKMNDPLENRARDARPDQIYIACSDMVTLDDLSIVNSAFWSVVPLSSRNVLIERLRVDAMNTPNRDGIDPVDCIDMTVRDCCIIAGDDGLCLKSSDDFGCRNIDISQLVIQSLASGIKFGTDSYHSLVNVRIDNCILKNINRCGVSLEAADGACIERVHLSHLDICDAGAPLYIVVGVRNRRPDGIFPQRSGVIRDVLFEHVRYEKAYRYCHTRFPLHEMMIIGEDEAHGIHQLCFRHCDFTLPGGMIRLPPPPEPLRRRYPEYDQHGSSSGAAFTLLHVFGFTLEDCTVRLEQEDIRPVIAAFACSGIDAPLCEAPCAQMLQFIS